MYYFFFTDLVYCLLSLKQGLDALAELLAVFLLTILSKTYIFDEIP